MKRRTLLLAAAVSGLLPALLPARAQQQGRVYRVGALLAGVAMPRFRAAFAERLAAHGFTEGRNLVIDARGATGVFHEDRELVRELLAAKADAIFTGPNRPTEAAQAATKTVPIIFVWVSNPVANGIVKAYAKPGANITGVTTRGEELLLKRLELARELLPEARRIAVISWLDGPQYAAVAGKVRKTAADLGFKLLEISLMGGQPAAALEAVLRDGAEAALTTWPHALQPVSGAALFLIAANKRVPVLYQDSDAVEAGGLISYGTSLVDDVRRGADLVARVLRGANPAGVPVDQASRFELAVNLKTARAMGLTIPPSILLRADRVIE